jgi:predicted permease
VNASVPTINDCRQALRLLVKYPGFSTVAAVTLALGIGLNVTVFAILNVLLFKPVAVRNASELLWVTARASGAEPFHQNLSYPDVADFGHAGGIAGAAGFAEARIALRAGSEAVRITGQIVTPTYFDVLGIAAVRGRTIRESDDRASADGPVAVIADGLARRLFHDPATAVGAAVEVNGQPFTIVGVAPPSFRGADLLSPADLWIPTSAATRAISMREPYARNAWWLKAIVRLGPQTGRRQAEAALTAVASAIAEAYPDSHKQFAIVLHEFRGATPDDQRNLSALALLPAVPLVVLLIACANVAGLLVARGVGRRREIAIRIALGASRLQLVRQLLTESLLLAAVGGAASLLVSMWAPDLLVRFAGAPLVGDFSPDIRVVLFTVAVSILTALAFGLAPALRASRSTHAALRGEPGAAEGGARSSRMQRLLVAGQLALSLMLLMTAGLFLRSVAQAGRAPVGFSTNDRVTLSIDLGMQRYSAARAGAFQTSILDRIRSVPGVADATLASFVPLGGRVMVMPFYPASVAVDPDARPERTSVNMVGSRFFETIGLPIKFGRGLRDADRSQPAHACVINEALAARLRSEQAEPADALIGRRLHLGEPASAPVEIVGISADALVDEFGEAPFPAVYLPHDGTPGELSIIAWTSLRPAAALNAIEQEVRSLDASLAVFEPRTMQQHLADRMDGERGLSKMLSVAGALALGLAAFGLYGVTAYTVTRRTREIGVRVALGASPTGILRLVLVDTARLAITGIVTGLVPGIAVAYVLSGMIFGVAPADPVVIGAGTALLSSAALVAAYVPARRALRVDPVVALRTE